jgi:hypothetical protein
MLADFYKLILDNARLPAHCVLMAARVCLTGTVESIKLHIEAIAPISQTMVSIQS